ncbi:hypothetical protein R1sor_004866 [Riccia sorocarpa]|uniref:DDE Tnp4 domain-containing protein n=1 Tax=Riccia sorocarpa TaxID=122646 RepID=A0ABD3HHW1_9MARC
MKDEACGIKHRNKYRNINRLWNRSSFQYHNVRCWISVMIATLTSADSLFVRVVVFIFVHSTIENIGEIGLLRSHGYRRFVFSAPHVMERLGFGGPFHIISPQRGRSRGFAPLLQSMSNGIMISSGRRRNWWVFSKSESWWEDLLHTVWQLPTIDRNLEWKRMSRMPYDLFLRLVDLIEPFMPPLSDWHLARKRIELEKCVAVVIYRLAHNVSLQELSDKFHVGQAGVVKYTRIITEILADRRKLFCKFVGLPKGSRLSSIIEDFASLSGIPQIAGSIDGCQIKLRNKPPERHFPAEYWNRHHTFSILLQGVCDANRNFLDVTCVLPGSQHDAAHLRVSSLWYKLTNNLIFQQPETRLPLSGESRTEGGRSSRAARNNPEEQQEAGQQHQPSQGRRRRGRPSLAAQQQRTKNVSVQPFLVGDAAYPLTQYIQKAFDTWRTGSHSQNEYDRHLRRARVRIEHTFELLKGRWQILDTGNPLHIREVAQSVLACCCLHNFVNYGGVQILETEREPDVNSFRNFVDGEPFLDIAESVHAQRTRIGKAVQQALYQYWCAHNVNE